MSAVVAVFVRRTIADSQVEFNTQANSLAEALAIAQQLANGTPDAAATAQAAVNKASKESKTTTASTQVTTGNDAGTASTEKSSQASAPTPEKSSDETEHKAAPALDYEKDIKPRVLTLSKDKGRDATIATLSRFGVAKATELNEDQWPAFLEFVNAVIDGKVKPEEALA